MQHKAGPSPVLTLVHCTCYLLVVVHTYKYWGGSTKSWGGGDCLSGYWPLQQRHLYLRGVHIYGGVLTCEEI